MHIEKEAYICHLFMQSIKDMLERIKFTDATSAPAI